MRDEAKTWWLFSGPDVASSWFFKRKSVVALESRTLIWVPLLQAMTLNIIYLDPCHWHGCYLGCSTSSYPMPFFLLLQRFPRFRLYSWFLCSQSFFWVVYPCGYASWVHTPMSIFWYVWLAILRMWTPFIVYSCAIKGSQLDAFSP